MAVLYLESRLELYKHSMVVQEMLYRPNQIERKHQLKLYHHELASMHAYNHMHRHDHHIYTYIDYIDL